MRDRLSGRSSHKPRRHDDHQASTRRAGTVPTILAALMLPLGFLVVASWRDESGAAPLIGVHVIAAGIATGVVGRLLRWRRRQQ